MDISEIIPACLVDEKGRDLLKHANSFGKGLDKFALLTLERYLESAIDFNEAYDLLTESYTNPGKYLQAIAKKLLLWLVVLAAIIYALWISGFAYHGDARTQNKLGLMYDKGLGVTQDYAEAVRWYRKAADQGHAGAQFNLGVMYSKGWGVTQDYTEAVRWYRKAAKQGTALAQAKLGLMYDKAWGVTQDYSRAHMWYSLATARGLNIAEKNRDLLAKKMTPAQIAKAQKLAREWKPKGK